MPLAVSVLQLKRKRQLVISKVFGLFEAENMWMVPFLGVFPMKVQSLTTEDADWRETGAFWAPALPPSFVTKPVKVRPSRTTSAEPVKRKAMVTLEPTTLGR